MFWDGVEITSFWIIFGLDFSLIVGMVFIESVGVDVSVDDSFCTGVEGVVKSFGLSTDGVACCSWWDSWIGFLKSCVARKRASTVSWFFWTFVVSKNLK